MALASALRALRGHQNTVIGPTSISSGTIGCRGDHRAARGPCLDHHIAQRLVTRRADQQIGRAEQRSSVAAPAEKMEAVCDPFAPRKPEQACAFRTLASDHRMHAGQSRQCPNQQVEPLVAVQPAQAKHEPDTTGQAQSGRMAPSMSGEKLGR